MHFYVNVFRGQKEKKYSLQEMLKMYPKTWAYLMECCNKFWCAEKVIIDKQR